jgi:uncharacterized protein (TIGR03083 family)
VEYTEYCDALAREARALGTAARAAGIDAAVPSCPDWEVADLLGHVGRLYRWVAGIVSDGGVNPSDHWSDAEPPPHAERFEWFDAGAELVVDTLRGVRPESPAWTWTTDHTAGFWARRQANESAVHRWDGQLAAGATEPIEHTLAVDGIDEFFTLIPFWRGASSLPGTGESIHFHCTDGDGEWLARLGTDGVVVTREHAKGDAALRASASDLMLFLYGRRDASAGEVFGDRALLDRWQQLVSW